MSREGRIVRELRQAGFTVLTRRQWGSKHRGVYQDRRTRRRFVGAADHLFAHISVTHDTGNVRADAQTIERIGMQRFGTGWSYNWGLHRSTRSIILGQPHDAAGAHTLNDKGVSGFPHNLNYWGHAVAFIGVPGDPFDDWCVRAAAAIEAAEKKHGACKNGANWYPHSKFAAKDCPCDPYRNKLGRIARTARNILDPEPAKEWDEMASQKEIEDAVRGVVRQVVRQEIDRSLDQRLNEHAAPKGNPITVNVTRGELEKAIALFLDSQPETRVFLENARQSPAEH